ncbi:hypothetical protein B296_00058442 [Ensete ventricosum]|uniref:Uncharacterized protein n=1 Tax=Ensete ventricosum TaxID=4639 RepID=A0A426X648_ENSVE|nr:hypothetical protein B296_00058442 [Ensete ventricosum]
MLRWVLGLGSWLVTESYRESCDAYCSYHVAAMYEVLDLVLQIIAFLGIMPVITVEATITSVVPVLGSRPQRVGSFEEFLLWDLEKDLCPSGVERNIGRPGNSLLTSLHPPPWEPRGWAPRGLSPGALLIFTFLRH